MSYMKNDRLYWPGGKKKALTLSYDDGVHQDERLLAIFRKYNLKATFNLNPGVFGKKNIIRFGKKPAEHYKFTAEEVPSMYEGFEIAAHGMEHTNLVDMDSARCLHEILNSRCEIEKLLQHPILGYVYANGSFEGNIEEACRNSGLRYARTVRSTGKFDIPGNFLEWDPTCHHNDEKLFELTEEFLSDKPHFSHHGPAKLFYVWGHAYEFDQEENWDRIEKFAETVSGRDDVWYATNEEIYRYVDAYRKLEFSVDSEYVYNPTCIPVWIGGQFGPDRICVMPGETAKLPEHMEI